MKHFSQPFCASGSHYQLDCFSAGLKGVKTSAKTWILLPSVMQVMTEFVFESTGTCRQQHVTKSQNEIKKWCRIWQERGLKAYCNCNCSVMFSWSNQHFHKKTCWLEQENDSSEAEKYSISVLHQQLLAVIAHPSILAPDTLSNISKRKFFQYLKQKICFLHSEEK